MHSRLRTLAFATVPLLLLAGAADAAAAARPFQGVPGATAVAGEANTHPSIRRVHDVRHDVRRVAERAGKDEISPARARRHGDLTSLRVSHGDRAVVTRVKLKSLTRHDRLFGAVVQLRTAKATYTAVVFRMLPGQRFQTTFDGGGQHSCDGLGYDLDYRHDTVTVTVPRACLGTPDWVRTRAVIDYFGPRGRNDVFFADAAPGSSLTPVPFLAKVWHPGA